MQCLPYHFFHSNSLFFQVPFNFESLLPYMNICYGDFEKYVHNYCLLWSHKCWLPNRMNCWEQQVVSPNQKISEEAKIIRGATCHKVVRPAWSFFPFQFSLFPGTLQLWIFVTLNEPFFRLILRIRPQLFFAREPQILAP